MKMSALFFALSALSSFSAFADMSIECARPGKGNDVYLSEQSGYEITDHGNPMIGAYGEVTPSVDANETIVLRLDDGSSRKWVYTFSNLKECRQNDTSTDVKLKIATVLPGNRAQIRETLTCECAID